jgi:site-specific DNA-methyltransferase (cytosine-N4-specific)
MDEAFRKGRPTDALDAQAFARKAHDSQYKHLPLQTSEDRTSDKELFSEALDSPALISLYHSIASLAYKPKDLVPIPWLVAMALQADGWYLRSDIIWSKPNPMPESVTDRPTKSHEYIFLLSKQEKYYYDQEAILESCSDSTHARLAQNIQDQIGSTRANGGAKTNGNMKAVHRNTGVGWDYTSRVNPGDGRARERIKKEGPNSRMHVPRAAGREDSMPNPSSSSLRDVGIGQNARPRKAAPNGSGTKNNESFNDAMAIMPTMRNKRSVWTVATESFKEAHFATYPQELITPCILAGCPVGGTVLDCFGGSCTTGQVAEKCGRNSILIELNPEYIKIGKRRTAQQGLAL